jgi:hypothetical protein
MTQDNADQDARLKFAARRSVLERETTWALLPEGLQRMRPGGKAEVFPYAAIVRARLQFSPSGTHPDRYLCSLHLQDGRKLHLVSTHYKGLMRFEDRRAAYAPFVPELVKRVSEANPQVNLSAGASPAQYYGLVVFLVLVAGLLAWGLDLPGRLAEGGWGGWVRIGVLLALLPILWAFLRANRPRPFTAEAIPPRLLPGS